MVPMIYTQKVNVGSSMTILLFLSENIENIYRVITALSPITINLIGINNIFLHTRSIMNSEGWQQHLQYYLDHLDILMNSI